MKTPKFLFAICLMMFSFALSAQDFIQFHQSGTNDSYELFANDSIYFNTDHSTLYFSNNGTVASFTTSQIDSITFVHDASTTISIAYAGETATVVNPLAGQGVDVQVTGAHVVANITTTSERLNFVLSGNSTNGSFKAYSAAPYNVLMNGVSLSNPTGPAFNSQSSRQVDLILVENTINLLSDGITYATAPNAEDQKATLFAEGDVEFMGAGSITIDGNGTAQHALATDADMDVKQGNITIAGSARDGIHAKDRLNITGGELSVAATDEGIASGGRLKMQCGSVTVSSASLDTKAFTSDSLVVISGGSLNLTHTGILGKGIASNGNVQISGGDINISISGASQLSALGSGMEVSHSAGISSDANVEISGGNVSVSTSGLGGRPIKTDFDYLQTGGTVILNATGNGATYTNSTGAADAYHSTCLKTTGDLTVNGGSLSMTNNGTGGHGAECEGNMLVENGASTPALNVTTNGTKITITAGGGGGGPGGGNSGTYDEPKAIKCDLTYTMSGGAVTIDSNDDGVKSLGSITINGGSLDIVSSIEGMESPNITINNGEVSVVSSDDSLNGTNGTGGESSDGSMVKITGGRVVLNGSNGDPLDSNGNVNITGGLIIVHGPQSSPEVGMDYNGTAVISGGTIVISGTNSNMTQGFSTSSTQRSLTMKSSSSLPANTIIHLEDSNGVELFSFKPTRAFYSVVFSSPALVNGGSYRLYSSGTHTGTAEDGWISGGTYTPGNLETNITVNGIVTNVTY